MDGVVRYGREALAVAVGGALRWRAVSALAALATTVLGFWRIGALAGLLVVASVLLVWSVAVGLVLARRLAATEDLRAPAFSLRPAIEPNRREIFRFDGHNFTPNTYLWVEVTNAGPTASFSARVRKAIGTGKDEYDVDEVAWEHTEERHYEIPRDHRARLRLANMCTKPGQRRLWFWTARSATWSPGGHAAGHRMADFGPVIEFDLTVTNSTFDTAMTRRLRIETEADGNVSSFDDVSGD